MKYLALSLILAFLSIPCSSQTIKLSDIEKLKKGTLIVALTGNDEVDNFFKEAISEFWTITEISEFLPYNEAKEKAKKDKSTYIMYITSGSSIGPSRTASSSSVRYKYISKSKRIKISDGKKYSDPILYCYYPTPSDGRTTKESLYYAMATMEHTASAMISDEIKSTLKWNKIYNKYNEDLKEYTVYLLEGWVEEGLTEERVQEIYPYPIKVVSVEEWSNAVLTKIPNVVYCIISPIPQAGDFTYVHYFLKSGEAKVVGTSYSMINPKFKGGDMSAGNITFIMKDMDLSKANIGYITEKNVRMYMNMVAD
jgi:uncharacterized protein (UPF0248 family)